MDFTGQVVIITGAGSGLGRAHALWFAERGAAVVVSNRRQPGNPSSSQKVVEEIVAKGGRAIADDHAAEDPAIGEALAKAALDAYGRIDVVVCNAGITHLDRFDVLEMDKFRWIMEINLWGSVNLVRAAWPTMVKQGYGRIVLTTSTGGVYGVPNSTPYSSAKAAVIGFAKALRFDIPQDTNIKVNVVAPSAMTKGLAPWLSDEMSEMLAPELISPVVGWMGSKACRDNGMVLFAAAGKVTRIRSVESEPAEIHDQEFTVDWDVLNSLEKVSEAQDVFESLQKMLPARATVKFK